MSAFIDEYRADFGVECICSVMDVSVSAYYQRAKGERCKREIEDGFYLAIIREEHEKNFCAYGARRMWKHLNRMGIVIGRDRVARIMRENGLAGAKNRGKRWKTTVPGGSGELVDLVNRNFTADRPNRTWVADFTYLQCWTKVAFLSFVIDVFSRRIIGWQFATHMKTSLVLDALLMALSNRDNSPSDVRLIHHSDRGCQYTSAEFTQTLSDHTVLASVGSVGDAYDNAMAESFVDSFKTELINDRVWKTETQMELAILEYISWFNNQRLHESLGDIPPVEYEALHQPIESKLVPSS